MDRNNRKGKESSTEAGFTLVELVVVIAILGILAGIGYMGYGAYIEYSKQAGDKEIIAAVNEAFAAACEEEGVARLELGLEASAVAPDGADKTKIKGIKFVDGLSDAQQTEFLAQFDNYYKGNEDAVLKYYNTDDIRFANGTDLFTVDVDMLNNQIRNIFQNSSFKGKQESVIHDIDAVLDILKFSIRDKAKGLNAKISAAQIFLGFDREDFTSYLKAMGIDGEGVSNYTLTYQIMNGALRYVTDEILEIGPSKLIDKYVNGNVNAYKNPMVDNIMTVLIGKGLVESGNASEILKNGYTTYMENGGGGRLFNKQVMDNINHEKENNKEGYEKYQQENMKDDISAFVAFFSLLDQNNEQLDLNLPNFDQNEQLKGTFNSVLGSDEN